MLESIDPTLTREEIEAMREEAINLKEMVKALPLKRHLDQFIEECKARLPSHYCWIESDGDIILQDSEGWKHILAHIAFEFEPNGLEQVCYATVKNYELKGRKEPESYNQAPPGLWKRYPYLYQVRISQETWLEVTKLWCERYKREGKQ